MRLENMILGQLKIGERQTTSAALGPAHFYLLSYARCTHQNCPHTFIFYCVPDVLTSSAHTLLSFILNLLSCARCTHQYYPHTFIFFIFPDELVQNKKRLPISSYLHLQGVSIELLLVL